MTTPLASIPTIVHCNDRSLLETLQSTTPPCQTSPLLQELSIAPMLTKVLGKRMFWCLADLRKTEVHKVMLGTSTVATFASPFHVRDFLLRAQQTGNTGDSFVAIMNRCQFNNSIPIVLFARWVTTRYDDQQGWHIWSNRGLNDPTSMTAFPIGKLLLGQ